MAWVGEETEQWRTLPCSYVEWDEQAEFAGELSSVAACA